MDGYVFAWRWLAHAAIDGLFVLCLGCLAARLCRQPVRRVRIVVLTLAAGLAVPWLALWPARLTWSAGFSLPAPPVLKTGRAESPPRPGAATAELPYRRYAMGDASQRSREAHPNSPSTQEVEEGETPGRLEEPQPAALNWSTLALLAFAFASAGWAIWWLLGQVLLWRIVRLSRPVPADVQDLFRSICGRGGRTVLLLETEKVCLPFTFTWARPVIVLPSALCDGQRSQELRFCLAHEWSHIERGDALAWHLASLAGLVLCFQPLYWWLRRQLKLCQDYLADDRAASLTTPEDYATYLVRLARTRHTALALPALGVGDRRSNLYRRVAMLVQDHEPLEHRCRTLWGLAAAFSAAVIAVVVSGLRLEAAPSGTEAATQEAKAVQDLPKTPGAPKQAGETLHYTGTVRDKDTGKPIAGATVVVRRSLLSSRENRVLQETKHTTVADGTYSFTIPPEQVADKYLYIELDVEHPDYATRAGFGYALGMILKNEKLNERPFFETIEMRPAKPIAGKVETPEGKPASGVEVLAYSRTDKIARGQFEYGSFARTKTDAEGKFRLPITTPGQGVFWILPRAYAPELHLLGDSQRGEIGTFTLKNGVRVAGRVLDVQGKPLAGVFIKADRERGSGPEFEALGRLTVADAIERGAETDSQGRFTFDPLPPGDYRVMPEDVNYSGDRSTGWTRRELPGVFAPKKLSIKEGQTPEELDVRASPHVVLEGQWFDSKGQPKSGWGSSVFGKVDGSFWFAQTRPDTQGKFSLKVPHGMEEVQLDISTNEHASTRHRMSKGGPLIEGRTVKLGTLDHDVKGIEIIRYVAPILVINATTRDGKQIKGFKAAVEYTKDRPRSEKGVHMVGGEPKQAIQDEQYDGRYRTSQLLPDSEANVTVSADGFATQSRKLSLPEGKTEEMTFVLEPK